MKRASRDRQGERGQTIILVAVALVSLLAMAALAIDVVTLYVARSEIQRAADALALAGAKAVADSGVTTLPAGDSNLSGAKTLAQSMVTAAITAVLPVNLVAGNQPTLVGTPTVTYPVNSNPQITVTLNTSLPTFFAKILGRRTATVTASATAEAYNPANVQEFTPITPTDVKPWLVANLDPTQPPGTNFVTPATGAIESPPNSVVGEQFNLTPASSCTGQSTCTLGTNPGLAEVQYVPAQPFSAVAQDVCPSCAGTTDYEKAIACADANSYVYLSCGGLSATNQNWSNTIIDGGLSGPSATGVECLIHAGGPGANDGTNNLQDVLSNPGPWPTGPLTIAAGNGSGNVSTSNSIVTIPIIDTTSAIPPVKIVGFLQAFINWVDPGPGVSSPGDINITVLNIAGCSNTPNSNPPVVGGMGTSPIPVRLITPP